jgi:hypothetical protein
MTFQAGDPRSGADHRTHDLVAIAAGAAGDLTGVEAAEVDRLVETCAACASLHADLAAIARATRTLPATATAPRDFRLTAIQAGRLRRGTPWRRVVRSLLGSRGIGRPLATAFTTLGLVGLLIASQPLDLRFASFGGSAADRNVTTQNGPTSGPTSVPGPNASAGDDSLQPVRNGNSEGVYSGGSTGAPSTSGQPKSNDGAGSVSPSDDGGRLGATPPVLIVVSTGLLGLGLGLFALRRFGRRLS